MLNKSITSAIEIRILRATTGWMLKASNLFKNLTIGITFRIMIVWSVVFTASTILAFIVTLRLF
ncbi:MAG TPA: hypothetical protein DGN60_07110 [Chloroflexi bacterium]|nr:hypothetical protein [Chloroflexota bacterium]